MRELLCLNDKKQKQKKQGNNIYILRSTTCELVIHKPSEQIPIYIHFNENIF